MVRTPDPVRIKACGCATPFGDAPASYRSLIAGRRALSLYPVLGKEGGDPVPLALFPGRSLEEEAPPIWVEAITRLGDVIPRASWGDSRHPVFITGSNFGVGSLYALRRTGNAAYAAWGAPAQCADLLRSQLEWGPDVTVVSHACVSSHLGLLMATRTLEAGMADEALVLTFDFVSAFVAGGFHALKILNSEFPAPYSDRPTGSIGLGDGAAFAVLSTVGGDWELRGQSLYNEMHHVTSNREDGFGFAECLAPTAEAASGRKVWFKGHGTGTLEAGRLEVAAAERAFPGAPIVGWKGSLGHTLGSCGLVEMTVAIEAMRAGRVPGTAFGSAPAMGPSVVLGDFDSAPFEGVVCASNAFGGAHASFLLCHV